MVMLQMLGQGDRRGLGTATFTQSVPTALLLIEFPKPVQCACVSIGHGMPLLRKRIMSCYCQTCLVYLIILFIPDTSCMV